MEYIKLSFPKYNGNESQYEHIIYSYLSKALKEKGYIIKIKKTNFLNVDNSIISNTGKGKGACDAYIFSENEEDKLFALLELESTGNLIGEDKGIAQVRNYANGLKSAYKSGIYKTDYNKIYIIAYDGQKIWISQYDLNTGNEIPVISQVKHNIEDGIEITDDIKNKFFDIFPEKEKTELIEKNLIRKIKQILRGDKNLQGNKAFVLTVLASIYGNTLKEDFNEAVIALKNLAMAGNKDSISILEKWDIISNRIVYQKGNNEINDKVQRLYDEVARRLFVVTQDKQLDLYGYIYEELAEKNNKKEEGEYYTPRTHIQAIINSVFNRYLLYKWKLNNNKEDSITKILNKRIVDPFCGSGGFLYIFLKIIKEKYNLDAYDLNEISQKSIWGLDKNEVTAAYFNLFLIGDGQANLKQVITSINWQNAWKFKVISSGDKDNVKIKKNDSDKELLMSIEKFNATFLYMLENLIDFSKIKEKFSISSVYNRINNITDFIDKYNNNKRRKDQGYHVFNELIKTKYKNDSKPILSLMYNIFKECSNNVKNIETYDDFINNLGNVDFLPTNVPYGQLDDIRFKGEIGNRLESQALIECIDLLKPSTQRTDDDNGNLISNNDGGIATIIIPSGIFEREDLEIREYLLKKCRVLSIVKLPEYTFSPYASIQTYAITIRKKAVFEFNSLEQPQDVFMYIIDNDGKANSDKRYSTNLINPERTEIYDNNGMHITSVYEFTHNEIETNLEMYPEGYCSKLERAWIYSKKIETVSFDWNQIRISQNWDGNRWITLPGNKWGFRKLKTKKCEKQVEKKKKTLLEVIKVIVEESNDFIQLDIAEQKEIVIKSIKENYLNNAHCIDALNKETIISDINVQNIKNRLLRDYLNNKLSDLGNKCIKFREYLDEIINNEIDIYPAEIKNDIKYINKEIDTIVVKNINDIILLKKVEYEEYDLVIDNYLLPETQLTTEEIINNIVRFKSMTNKVNYNSTILETKLLNELLKKILSESVLSNNFILLGDFLSSFYERGLRLTEVDIYRGHGKYPVYSSTVTGPCGYFNKKNREINERCFIYTIEGNAGYILIPQDKEIFLTDVAGIIEVKKEYYDKYNVLALAIYLQHLFIKNRHNTGKQPKFLLKRNLNIKINLDILEGLSSILNNFY